jgi:hypothetical protein
MINGHLIHNPYYISLEESRAEGLKHRTFGV